MYKETMFVTTAAILVIAIVSSSLFILKAASTQINMTNASGSGKNMTTAAVGCIGTVRNMKVHSNLPRCAVKISK